MEDRPVGHILITHNEGNTESGGVRISAFKDRELELSYTLQTDENIVGNIYVGHVENIVKNLKAAFVRFRKDGADMKDNTGYLPLSEVVPACILGRETDETSQLRNGDLVLVQVHKPAVKTKQVALTMFLSISGRFTALTLGRRGIGCSKKLEEKTRDFLVKRFRHDVGVRNAIGDSYGLILRTECAAIAKDSKNLALFKEAAEEVSLLVKQLTELLHIAPSRAIGSCLFEIGAGEELSNRLSHSVVFLKRLLEEGEIEIVAEDAELCSLLSSGEFLKSHPEVPLRVRKKEEGSLSVLYGLGGQLEKASQRRVWLDSGAYLIIEATEAMHVIDVNTGKSIDKKGDLFLQINLEAAKECLRQIRLRNLSGMILIDFVNMPQKSDYDKLSAALKNDCSLDPVNCTFVDFTGLGIAEITRNKNS